MTMVDYMPFAEKSQKGLLLCSGLGLGKCEKVRAYRRHALFFLFCSFFVFRDKTPNSPLSQRKLEECEKIKIKMLTSRR
jgi:hypothetical protein